MSGTSHVGGIVGYSYRRYRTDKPIEEDYNDEEYAYIKDCSIDKSSLVKATGNYVGGICGTNYGSVIIGCVNHADVTGKSIVGGIAGQSRDYWNNVDAYVIACGASFDATITATDGNAGGIVGETFKDNNHQNTKSYFLACYSQAQVSGNKMGSMFGQSVNGSIYASYVIKNNATKYSGDGKTISRYGAEHYASVSEINQEAVNEMNAYITEFNQSQPDGMRCNYQWSWTEGSWPVLVATQE